MTAPTPGCADVPVGIFLEISDLSIAFDGVRVVEGLDLRLDRGESVALVGESGSGKSVTALSILQLLSYPRASHPSGSIRVEGRDVMGADEKEMRAIRGSRISMVFQEPMTSLNPLHTIRRQVEEVLSTHRGLRGRAARERTVELLELVGLQEASERLDSFPHQLSGGQRQRVMIAMAIANEPDLLIADEPTTALDVTVQAQILALIKELQERLGMALLLITHDLGIVRSMAERVYVMERGRVVEDGLTSEIFQRPQHPYTRKLIDAEPRSTCPIAEDDAPVLVETNDLTVEFPLRADRASPDRRTPARSPAATRPHLPLHQSRPQGRARPLRRHRRHEGRPDRRARAGRPALRCAARALHSGAHERRARPGKRDADTLRRNHMRTALSILIAGVALAGVPADASAQAAAAGSPDPARQWNQFRGPTGDGLSRATGVPVVFGEDRLVRWKTPIHDEGRIYFTSTDGTVSVISASRKFEVLAENEFDERLIASPAIVDGSIILRSETHVYRISR